MAVQPRPITAGPRQVEPEAQITTSSSLGETFGAAFRLENTLVSGAEAFGVRGERLNARTHLSDEGIFRAGPDPDFDVFDAIKGTNYEEHSKSFVGVYNRAEAMVVKQKIDRETEDRRILETEGISGFAAMITAGIIDPINIIPIGGTAITGLKTGQSIGVNAARTAAAGGLGALAAEIPLQATQETRTAEESGLAILGGLVLGGVLGGGVGAYVAKKGRSGSTDSLGGRVLSDPMTESQYTVKASVGAAEVGQDTIEENTPVGSFGVGKALSIQSPASRGIYTNSETGRNTMLALVEQPQIFNKNLEGKSTTSAAGPVETQVTLASGEWGELEDGLFDLYMQRQKGRPSQAGDKIKAGATYFADRKRGETLTDFRNEISNGFMVAGEHPDPIVAKAIDAYSQKFEEYGRQAEEMGIIPKGSVDAARENGGRYLPVDYDVDVITSNVTEWKGVLTNHFQQNAEKAAKELDIVSQDLAKLKNQRAEVEALLPDNSTLDLVRAGGVVDLGFAKRPVIDLLKEIGGVDPASELAGELSAIDITPKTAPGLFKKGGRSSLDNLVAREFELLNDNLEGTIDGYLEQDGIIGLIAREVAGDPARTFDQLAQLDERVGGVDSVIQFLDQNDIDYQNLTNDQIRQRILRLDDDSIAEVTKNRQPGDDGVSGTARTQEDLEAEIGQMNTMGQGSSPKFGKSEARRIEQLEARSETLRKLSRAEDRAEAALIADEVTHALQGSRMMDMPDDVISGPRGPLKEKTLDLPLELSKPFRNTNISDLSRKYIRVSKVDMSLVQRFGRTDLKDQFAKITDDFDILSSKAVTSKARVLLEKGELEGLSAKDKAAIVSGNRMKIEEISDETFKEKVLRSPDLQKEQRQLQKQKGQLEKDLTGALNRVRGQQQQYRDPNTAYDRVRRGVIAANFTRLLGGMTQSALPDLGMPIFRYGFKAFSQGYGQLATNLQNWKLGAKEMKYWTGAGMDMLDSMRIQSMSETYRGAGSGKAFDRFIDEASRVFSIVTLMAPWNAFMKGLSGGIVSGYVEQNVKALAKGLAKADGMPQAERAKYIKELYKNKHFVELARINIDPEMALRLSNQMEKYAPNFQTDRVFNYEQWDDVLARDNLRQAIAGEVDRTILTPKNMKPLWMDNPEGQVIGQFKSFGFEAAQTILIPGLQRKDAQTMMGFATMIALGTLVYNLKEQAAGREVPAFTDNPEKWFVEGVDRSGIFGWLMDVNNVAEKMTGGKVGMSALTGETAMSRFQSRNAVGALAGPTLGLLQDIPQLTAAAAQGSWTESDTSRMRRLVPLQNALVIRRVFDDFENGMNKALGL